MPTPTMYLCNLFIKTGFLTNKQKDSQFAFCVVGKKIKTIVNDINMSESEKLSREELRRKLRNKIKNKRNPNELTAQLPQRLKEDPAGLLLSMGIDNADVLKNAQQILKNKDAILQSLHNTMQTQCADASFSKSSNESTPNIVETIEEEEEEAPPP